MRYLWLILTACSLFICAVGDHIHERQVLQVQQDASKLRPFLAKVEQIRSHQGKRSRPHAIVSYVAGQERRLSILTGTRATAGQELTVWAKPNFQHAYL